VWQRTQSEARSREEYELGTITLRLLSLIRQGREATLDLACVEAFGFHFNVWRQKSLERQSQMAWEFAALVPDYDPSVESESRLGRQATGRRPVLPLPEPKIPALQESVLQMPLPRTGTK
jgi:hypothetical protein